MPHDEHAARNRRNFNNARPSPECDVWLNPPAAASSSSLHPSPQVSFPASGQTTPMLLSANNSPYFDAKSSPSIDGSPMSSTYSPHSSKHSPSHATNGTGALGLSWRQAVADPRRRPRKKSAISVQHFLVGGGALLALTVLYFVFARGSSPAPTFQRMGRQDHDKVSPKVSATPARSAGVRGKAVSFRDELSHDMKYVTSAPSGDFGEQIYNFFHLTYLSRRLARIPLIPPFVTQNAAGEPVSVAFTSIFDMPRFSQATSVSALDWSEIRPPGSHTDPLGCWVGSVRREDLGARTHNMRRTGIDVSFFPMRAPVPRQGEPERAKLLSSFDFLASFEQDDSAQSGLVEQAYHSKTATSLSSKFADPDTHVLCFDHTLYRPQVGWSNPSLELDAHPAFEEHGSALHFLPELQETALDLAAHILNHRGPYIAVDVSEAARRVVCAEQESCGELRLLPFLEAVERARHLAVRSVGKSREQRHNVRALSVLVTTDVTDISFKGEIAAAGWTLVDYDDLEIRQKFGQWLPQVMDPVLHSKAVAFVGSKGSSQSLLSALRVKKWRGGHVDLV
ncbi:hypothetical protein OIV83_000971 [Microbotryomycetes sp. JL201]|nr:hypothetical protein OIV83_000971 [Microbotryomycetes sp. JL201]